MSDATPPAPSLPLHVSEEAIAICAQIQSGELSIEDAIVNSQSLYATLDSTDGFTVADTIKAYDAHRRGMQNAFDVYQARQQRATDSNNTSDGNHAAAAVGDEEDDEADKLEETPLPAMPSQTGPTQNSISGGVVGSAKKDGVWQFGTQPQELDPYAQQTFSRQRDFQGDLTGAVQFIKITDGAPILPDQIWKSILEAKYVDFSKILATKESGITLDESETKLGNLTILGSSLRSSPVRNYADWDYCYELYAKACALAYPHKQIELDAYQRYLKELFRSQHFSAYGVVISYDQFVRTKVAGNIRLKLDDPGIHWVAAAQFFTNTGLGSGTAARNYNATKGSQGDPEVCRMFNKNNCKRGTACRYRHECSDCGGAHPASNCPKEASGSGGRVPRKRAEGQKASSA